MRFCSAGQVEALLPAGKILLSIKMIIKRLNHQHLKLIIHFKKIKS